MDILFVIDPAFRTGRIVVTKAVYQMASENPDFASFIQASLNRHVEGHREDLEHTDERTYDRSRQRNARLLSAHKDDRFPKNSATIWIITEADGSSTTILFPDEY